MDTRVTADGTDESNVGVEERKLRTMPFLKPQVWRWGIAREPSKARSRASAARLRS